MSLNKPLGGFGVRRRRAPGRRGVGGGKPPPSFQHVLTRPTEGSADSSRSAHARRPSLFSPAKAAPSPNFRDAPMSLLQGADPFGGTQGGRGGARETKGTHRGPKGTQGRLRRPWGDGPMGPFGVIPKLFRMESHFEWSLNCAGKRTLISRWGQIVPTSRNGPKWSNMVSKLTIWSIWATMGPK